MVRCGLVGGFLVMVTDGAHPSPGQTRGRWVRRGTHPPSGPSLRTMKTSAQWCCADTSYFTHSRETRGGRERLIPSCTGKMTCRLPQRMDRPGVRQVPEGSGEQRKMKEVGCEVICDAPTTSRLRGQWRWRTQKSHTRWTLHCISKTQTLPRSYDCRWKRFQLCLWH